MAWDGMAWMAWHACAVWRTALVKNVKQDVDDDEGACAPNAS